MSTAFVTTRRVEFSDTDAAGIVHFVAFFRMMEQAEHDLLRSAGLSVVMRDSAGTVSWPRVNAKCDFTDAARFEDLLEIEVRIARLGKRSITYAHRFRRDGMELATGEITAVCCRIKDGKPPKSIDIPAAMVKKLKPFVASASSK
jgi:4-hydroxybenzoyl-CoA thioesterase/acyl-CoA thioester hydrolase